MQSSSFYESLVYCILSSPVLKWLILCLYFFKEYFKLFVLIFWQDNRQGAFQHMGYLLRPVINIRSLVWEVLEAYCMKECLHNNFCLPCHDYEEVQSVPGVAQVTATAKDPQSHHLYHHLQGEEDVDECIKGLWAMGGRQTQRKMSWR